MSQIITLCLGMVILAFLIPNQVHSQSVGVNQNSSSVSNSSAVSPATTSTNTTTPHSHANSLYISSSLLLSIAFSSLLNFCC